MTARAMPWSPPNLAAAASLAYLAVHGTGTPLGDPIGECSS